MKLNEYQEKAMQTCMPSCDNVSYMLLNLQAEVGELSGKIAKAIRKEQLHIEGNDLVFYATATDEDIIQFRRDVAGELGDVLWQLSGLCFAMGFDLKEIAQKNLKKLADRQQRGVIDGDGDYR